MATGSDHQGASQQKQMRGEEHRIEPQLIRRHFHRLTLDTNTANRKLSLSENNRKVTWEEKILSYPDHVDRFDRCPQVLCTEGLSGHCYWEVEWSVKVDIAVTYRAIKRRGFDDYLGYNDKSWSLGCLDNRHGNYYNVTHNWKHPAILPVRPSGSNRVGVYLDWSAGTLSFYRVSSDTLTHLYTFQSTFTQPLYPAFRLFYSSSVTLCQIKLSSDEVDQSNMGITSFTPSVNTEDTTNAYSFNIPGAGLIQCDKSGLVFGTTGEGEVLYRCVQWENEKLQSTGKTPVGPLFSIKCSQESISQLRLPHCYGDQPGDDLSVAHFTDEGEEVELLKPQEVTQTHVVVNVTQLSLYGIVETVREFIKPTKGQVLLFLQPPRCGRQILNVFLLPSNVPLKEVKVQHAEDKHVKTPSFCLLTPYKRYSLQSTSNKVQPQDTVKYQLNYGPNYHPTFEVQMDLKAERVKLEVLGSEKDPVWQRDIILGRHGNLEAQSKGASILSASIPVGASDFVDQHRNELIQRVNLVEPILDRLRKECVITHEAQSDVISKRTRQKKMRKLMELLDCSGKKAKGLFYKCLEIHEKFLLDELMRGDQEPVTEEEGPKESVPVTEEEGPKESVPVTEEQGPKEPCYSRILYLYIILMYLILTSVGIFASFVFCNLFWFSAFPQERKLGWWCDWSSLWC